jgi:outer membrane receptor protein involved in Fe transport
MMLASLVAAAQDPSAVLEGLVTDRLQGALAGATVTVTNERTGLVRKQLTTLEGTYAFPVLPVGDYTVAVEKEQFAPFKQGAVRLNVNQTVRLNITLEIAAAKQALLVEATPELVQTSSNVLGSVVTDREVVDLPLNGRNFAQLGLLQLGVVPMTSGLTEQGGERREGHAYIVNGERPESNNYLVDGARVVNRIDGGFGLKPPIDAIEEFKILTHTAPPEYGGTSGGNTSIVTRSGGNEVHGAFYDFVRNDMFDTRNFFVSQTEPLKQNQFGGTTGGPVRRGRLFYFGYYEGFRNRQGITRGDTVPTPAQREGDFSANPTPLINTLTGQPYPGGIIPAASINPLAGKLLGFYPLGNVSPSFYSSTQPSANDTDQGGGKFDYVLGAADTASARYTLSRSYTLDPFSILGSDLPGFPVQNNTRGQLFSLAETHIAGNTINSFRGSFFRDYIFLEKRLSGLSPDSLGFGYDTTTAMATGAPFLIVNGYSNMGDPAIGPRDTTQNDYEFQDSVAHTAGRHSFKFGGLFRRTQVNSVQGHYANGVYNFTSTPASDPFANFLLGTPSTFTQGGGDFYRGLRSWDLALYAQDEWRVSNRFTFNYGARYEISTPFSEIDNRLNAFAPGVQSVVDPSAPLGILFPGDPGVPATIAPIYYKGIMPRVGIAWDPDGSGKWAIRTGYAIFYDTIANGVGGPLRVATQSAPWVTMRQVTGNNINFIQPLGTSAFTTGVFTNPTNLFTIGRDLRPPYAQDWNLSIQRKLGQQVLEVRYVGTKGTRLPRFVEADPAVYGPGATAGNAGRRRVYAGCPSATAPCSLGYVALVTDSTSSTYHSAQASLSRRFSGGFGFTASYTFSKTLDYVSSLHIAGPAPILVSGEMDLAQNPFDLKAEHGPSLFDARHRLVVNGLYEIPWFHKAGRFTRAMLDGWQMNAIVTASSPTPFTVYDSTNVSLQAPIPPVAGTFASRPDQIASCADGPHTPQEWVSASDFVRLNPRTQAGQFGNEGRNTCRGAGIFDADVSLVRTFRVSEKTGLQFRAESFNVLNHPNFGLPVNDLASPNFGVVLEAGPPRLIQFALKLLY